MTANTAVAATPHNASLPFTLFNNLTPNINPAIITSVITSPAITSSACLLIGINNVNDIIETNAKINDIFNKLDVPCSISLFTLAIYLTAKIPNAITNETTSPPAITSPKLLPIGANKVADTNAIIANTPAIFNIAFVDALRFLGSILDNLFTR